LFFTDRQKDEPPEITYCVVNQNGMQTLHVQTLTPTQPMPEQSELDAKFTELLVRITPSISVCVRIQSGSSNRSTCFC
jgi:hypothetical protein